jgi:TPR repeat protein
MDAYQQGDYAQAFKAFFQGAEQGDAMAQHLLGTLYQTGKGVERDPEAGFQWSLKAAQGGVMEAQFQVGLMYLQGEGVTENEEKAIDWLWEAADRGYPQASELLQFIFSDDFGDGC